MDKKIFDIIPPSLPGEPETPDKDGTEEEKKSEPKEVSKKAKPPVFIPPVKPEVLKIGLPKACFFRTRHFVFLFVFLLLAGLAAFSFYFYLPQASVQVWLKTEQLRFQESVELARKTDAVERSLSGRIIVEEQTFSGDFPATGQVQRETKAEGVVKIYNDYSTAAQPLIATTRLVSSDGSLFRLVERVVVPGGTLDEKEKLIPGVVEARVRADLPGPEYNIGPSIFSIPGFAGTPKYTSFYAKSSTAMKGGAKGQTSVVSAQDLEKAKKSLEAKAGEKIDSALKNRVVSGLVLARQEKGVKIINSNSLLEAGAEAKTFTYQVKAREEAVLLAQDDLTDLAKTFYSSRLAAGRQLLSASLKTESRLESVDSASGKASLVLSIYGQNYEEIDLSSLKEQLKGKSKQEVEISFQDWPQVARIRLKIFPSFFKNLPQEAGKISFSLDFE